MNTKTKQRRLKDRQIFKLYCFCPVIDCKIINFIASLAQILAQIRERSSATEYKIKNPLFLTYHKSFQIRMVEV